MAMAAERFAPVAPDGAGVLVVSDYASGDSLWVDELRNRVLTADMPRCRHLERQPGEGYVDAAKGHGRCLACHPGRMAAGRDESLECGRCRVAGESTGLRPVAIQLVPWVMCSALCLLCAEFLVYEGRRPGASALAGSSRVALSGRVARKGSGVAR